MIFRPHALMLTTLMLAALIASPSAQAGLLAYESFTNLTADAALNSQGSGSGWSGGWSADDDGVYVRDISLSYSSGDITIGGGSQAIEIINRNATGSGYASIASRALTSPVTPTDGGAVYISFLIQTNGFDSQGDIGTVGALTKTSGGYRNNLLYAYSEGDYTGGPGAVGGITRFLVVKITGGPDTYNANNGDPVWTRVDVFSSPTTLTEPASASVSDTRVYAKNNGAVIRTGSFDSIDDILIFSGYGGLIEGESFYLDEIRVSDTWTGAVTAVPEPTTLLLLAIGSVLMAPAKHRRFRC